MKRPLSERHRYMATCAIILLMTWLVCNLVLSNYKPEFDIDWIARILLNGTLVAGILSVGRIWGERESNKDA